MIGRRVFIVAAVMAALALPSSSLAQAGPGKVGGTFNAAVTALPPTLDVMTSTAAATRQATWFFLEPLMTYDENYKPVPLLAKSWDVSDDGLTYTFHLKEGVLFHNGQEMTADDVVASFARYLDVSPQASAFGLVDSFKTDGKYDVVYSLSAPSAGFIDAMAYPVAYAAVMPKAIIEGKGAGELTATDMIGTGPYKLAAFKPDDVLRLERFDGYHTTTGETTGLAGNKTPYFDTVNLILVPEAGARMAGLETGEYDFAQDLPFTSYSRLQDEDDITPYVLKPDRWTVLDFNYCDPMVQNLSFRKAIQAALDMNAIGAAQTSGISEFYRVQPSIFFTESPWYTEVGSEPYNQHDIEKAKQYLAESGYNGEEVVMLTNRNYDYMYKAVLAAAQQLKKELGLNVTVQVMDWPAQRAMWKDTPGWQIDETGLLSQASFAPDAFSSIYGSGANRKCHSNPELDALFKKASEATTKQERQQAYDQIQTTFYDSVTAIKTVDLFALHGLRTDIQNFKPWYNITRFWNIWRQ